MKTELSHTHTQAAVRPIFVAARGGLETGNGSFVSDMPQLYVSACQDTLHRILRCLTLIAGNKHVNSAIRGQRGSIGKIRPKWKRSRGLSAKLVLPTRPEEESHRIIKVAPLGSHMPPTMPPKCWHVRWHRESRKFTIVEAELSDGAVAR